MKILALGALWVPYIRENWFDAFSHALREEVVCLNAGPLLAYRNKTGRQTEGFHSAYIYDVLRRGRFDCLFFYHDWIFGDFPDRFFEKVRSAGVKTVAFHPDDEPEHWYARNMAYDHHYDVVASHSTAGVERRKASGWGDRVVYTPWGYNPRTCHALPGSQKQYDVVFIGKHKVDTGRGVSHVEDGMQREHVLVRLAEACSRKGWNFKVFGYGWDKHPFLQDFYGGLPTQEEVVRIYNETRVVFNPAWSSDGNPHAVQTKLRHFEVPGCGAFQITNSNPELAKLFVAGEEIEFYGSDEELLEKVEFYVKHDALREQIAAMGHARALRDHTLDRRAKELFAHVAQLYPTRAGNLSRRHSVRRIDINHDTSLENVRRNLMGPQESLAGCEWVHFVGGDFLHVATDYDVVAPFMDRLPNEIIGVSTYFKYEGLADNPLQPKLMETDAVVLPEDVDVDEFDFGEGGPCARFFVGVQQEWSARLLMNYLIPRHRVFEVLDAFIDGSTHVVDALNAVPSGRIVSEVAVRPPEGHEIQHGMIRNHEYVRRLRKVLPTAHKLGMRTVLYGISGMGEIAMRIAKEIPGFKFFGVIDRSLRVAEYGGSQVLQPSDLHDIRPDLIILAAGASGASIHATIESLEGEICILPLYDLSHPTWQVVLP